jgi:aldose 1-epimerase
MSKAMSKAMLTSRFAAAALIALASHGPAARAADKPVEFGTTADGARVYLYTLSNKKGVEAKVTNYGGTLVSLKTPDRNGALADIVLGFDSLDGYLGQNPFFGATVGRYANRIGNARFTLNGVPYQLDKNSGVNSIHGGTRGLDKRVWTPRVLSDGGLELTYLSQDGEGGYPGNLKVTVTYRVTNADELRIDYAASSDKDTVVNFTNHSYFNLKGQGTGDILGHLVQLNADRFTPVDAGLIPTGELRSVEGTPFDFRKPTAVGARIDQDDEQLKIGRGYDHNWVITRINPSARPAAQKPALAAHVTEPQSGRVLEVLTTEPGVQFYTANNLGTVKGKGGQMYGRRSALCLETQHFPDSPNKPNFPSTLLPSGHTFRSTTVFRFSRSQR